MVRTAGLANYSDVHFTDGDLARRIVEHFAPEGRILEPFRGAGAFYQHFPGDRDWCEITEGRDFFAYSRQVDWLISNPPFSNLTAVFEHAFEIAAHCVFLIPISKYFSSRPRIDAVRNYGGLREMLHVGTGRDIGFDIGFPFAAMHFERGYKGPIYEAELQPGTV